MNSFPLKKSFQLHQEKWYGSFLYVNRLLNRRHTQSVLVDQLHALDGIKALLLLLLPAWIRFKGARHAGKQAACEERTLRYWQSVPSRGRLASRQGLRT